MGSAAVSGNLLLQSSSTAQHPAADTADWTGRWVCVGVDSQLTEVGAVLPATIGHHGTHVWRSADGFEAAINARPFGGCTSIPVHCGSTRNVRCPHLACAFSEDGGVLDGTTDPTGVARVGFLGDGRRKVGLPLAQWGPLLFVNVTVTDPPPLVTPDGFRLDGVQVVATGQRLTSGNWVGTPMRAASAVAETLRSGEIDVTAMEPNLAVVRSGSDTVALLSRPAGLTRSIVTWAVLSPDGVDASVDPRLIDLTSW